MKILKEVDIKSCTYYFFDAVINIKSLDANKNKVDKKSNKNISIYYIGYETIKDHSFVKIIRVNPLYLFINKINETMEKNV